MCEAYSTFASVYDMFMDNVPYEEWAENVANILGENGIEDGIVLDLGCGSGTITELLAKKGYDMIGVDISPDMLAVANEKKLQSGHDILYLCQDMREFELYGTVSAIVSICDSINYITDAEDLKRVFRLVNNYLDYDGVFIFDLNTRYKYEQLLSDNVFAENREDCSFIWENYYNADSCINEYDLTLYISKKRLMNEDKTVSEDDSYLRFEEFHEQKAYDIEDVVSYLKESGLIVDYVYDADGLGEPNAYSQRVYIVSHRPRSL